MDKQGENVQLRRLDCCSGARAMLADFQGHSFSRHAHDEYAVGCILRGGLKFHFLRKDNLAGPGEINLTVPGEVHDGCGADSSGWSYRMFYLPPELVEQAAEEAGAHGLPAFPAGVLQDPQLARLLICVHTLAMQPRAPRLAVESQLLRLLVNWVRRHADSRTTAAPSRQEPAAVARAKEYMAARLEQNIRLDGIASAAALSRFHCIRVFEAATGLTPYAWLLQQRLIRAESLLSDTTDAPLKLAYIAAACGFADQAHMTRLFKARFGVTPGKYRTMLQNS